MSDVTCSVCFFFNDTATTEIYTLSLHDALPIRDEAARAVAGGGAVGPGHPGPLEPVGLGGRTDRKSTRLNSSHTVISYAVFCLKKKKNKYIRFLLKKKKKQKKQKK